MNSRLFGRSGPNFIFSHEPATRWGEIGFAIKGKEYATPRDVSMCFFAEADMQTNQKTAAFTPLAECAQAVQRFPH